MERTEYVITYEFLGCRHLDEDDSLLVQNFCLGHPHGGHLAEYIKTDAFLDEKEKLARTYLVFDIASDELVAYFSLKAGMVATNEQRFLIHAAFDMEPGVELANFAMNGEYVATHPEAHGLGAIIFREMILPIVHSASEFVGIDILYIYALPNKSLIQTYQAKYGFTRLPRKQERALHRRQRPRYDEQCTFMYMTL